MEILIIFAAFLPSLLVGLVARLCDKQSETVTKVDAPLQMASAVKTAYVLLIIMFTAIVYVSFRDDDEVKWMSGGILTILIGITYYIFTFRAYIANEVLHARSFIGHKQIPLDDIIDIHISKVLSSVIIKSCNGKRIYISIWLAGIEALILNLSGPVDAEKLMPYISSRN